MRTNPEILYQYGTVRLVIEFYNHIWYWYCSISDGKHEPFEIGAPVSRSNSSNNLSVEEMASNKPKEFSESDIPQDAN